jgi:DNA-binding NarL/FixJ family response regulator
VVPQLPGAGARRIVVVDDYQPFRLFLRSFFQEPEFHIIGETSDGLEAVSLVESLRPDIVLLDIGLPSLNGIEVLRRIRPLVPTSKIIMLSQEVSQDVVEAAMSCGANGYVFKSQINQSLMECIRTVERGVRYLSESLRIQGCIGDP